MQYVDYQRVAWGAIGVFGCVSRLGGVAGGAEESLVDGSNGEYILAIVSCFVKNGDDGLEISLGKCYSIY